MQNHCRTAIFQILPLLLWTLSLTPTSNGQGFTGRWAVQGKAMDNGETQRLILELTQTGNALAGRLTSFPAQATINAADLHLKEKIKSACNLWTHAEVTFKNGKYSASVPEHGILLLRITTTP
jgi:hypothetical protein